MTKQNLNDGLANVLTGAGTSVDKKQHREWAERHSNSFLVDVAYRGSWLMRKVVRIPAQDAVRGWLDWQADKDQIALIEKEEKRLRVKDAIKMGVILGRLGGGVIVMGVNDGQSVDQPIDEKKLAKGSLRYLRYYGHESVKLGPIVDDPNDDDFGLPAYFTLKAKDAKLSQDVDIHRDRILVFKGEFAGHVSSSSAALTGADNFWGESIVTAVNDAVMNATEAQDEIAGLISEAKVDIYGIPDLMNMMGDSEAEKRVMRRMEIAQASKSIHRSIIRDAAETWEQRQINWAGMPEVIRIFVSLVGAASDIPATRLMGKSPDGMNATGESDQENYDQMVADIQSDKIGPELEKLHRVLIPSALGPLTESEESPRPYYLFAPLHKPLPKDAAEVESKEAASVKTLIDTALIPETAMAQAVANRMIESGRWPGLEEALAELGDKWWGIDLTREEDDDDGLPSPADGSEPREGDADGNE